jgi:hypothetical protein
VPDFLLNYLPSFQLVPLPVVRKSFFAAGFAACGCKARSKKRESL